MFYFIPLFSARPFNLRESWDYNLNLMKGNRLKLVFPGIIFFLFYFSAAFLFLIQIFPIFEGLNIEMLFLASKIGIVIVVFFNTFMMIFFVILHCIIYLNVEYMDRKIK